MAKEKEPTKWLGFRVTEEVYRLIKIHIAEKGITLQKFMEDTIKDKLKNP